MQQVSEIHHWRDSRDTMQCCVPLLLVKFRLLPKTEKEIIAIITNGANSKYPNLETYARTRAGLYVLLKGQAVMGLNAWYIMHNISEGLKRLWEQCTQPGKTGRVENRQNFRRKIGGIHKHVGGKTANG